MNEWMPGGASIAYVLSILMHCNKNIALHKRSQQPIAPQSGSFCETPGTVKPSVLGAPTRQLYCLLAQLFCLVGEGRNLCIYVFRMKRKHILWLFRLQELLRELK